ncbi:MAG TPA: metallophosphoesterase family protein [Gaiellaceae bacterium]|nr:metallophosphoesterase family protein [Gaiellaceae bacterium]
MTVAALYDVHGNLPALEAVLAEVDADTILAGGDVVLGPMPRETLALLRERGATFIRGNTDRAVGGGVPEDDPWLERVHWVRDQLDEDDLDFLRTLPHPLSLAVDSLGQVLFCHGSPRSDEEILTAATPPKRLDPILDGVQERVVVCGHTHVQFDRLVGDRRLVNAGSVGMPYEGEAGIACWALLGPDVELRRTRYDAEHAAAGVRGSGMPGADEFAQEYVLHPATAEEATTHFEALASGSES